MERFGKSRWLAVVLTVVAFAWMLLIFAFSAQPDTESLEISGHVSYQLVSGWNEAFQLEMTGEELQEEALRIELPVRKAAHMGEYAVLACLVFGAFTGWKNAGVRSFSNRRKCFIWSAQVAFLYACSDEFHQLYVPGRAGRITDVLIDTTGAIGGLLIVFVVTYWYNQYKKRKR